MEPFAGGASVSLHLLGMDLVDRRVASLHFAILMALTNVSAIEFITMGAKLLAPIELPRMGMLLIGGGLANLLVLIPLYFLRLKKQDAE